MASFVRNNTTIHYEDSGSGPALLLIAPGGMRSHVGVWEKAPFNPLREFAAGFRTVAMDQRNAGQSHGPIEPGMGWDQHTQDQLALLDELPLRPTFIVHSGGGLHPYWLLRELWMLETHEERKRAARLVAGWQVMLRERAGAHGWKLDSTHDLARVLRVPGTKNCKQAEPRSVRMLREADTLALDEGAERIEYNPSEFEEWIDFDAADALLSKVKPPTLTETETPDIDGGLIGGASLQADDFVAIVRAAASTPRR